MPEDVLTAKLELFILESKDHRADTIKSLAEILKDGKENLVQSIKTNGRVTSLEKTTTQHSIAIEAFQELRWWVKGAFWLWCAIVPVFIFAAPFALSYYVHKVSAEELQRLVDRETLGRQLSTPMK